VDVDAAQPGVVKLPRAVREQDPVRGQREVIDAGDRGEEPHEIGQALPHERLAAGQSDFSDPEPGRDASEPLDLLEREHLAPGHVRRVLLRHAIEAADIAAVGDADTEVVVEASKSISERLGRIVRRHSGILSPPPGFPRPVLA
jgi:hypothetical protein